MGWNCIGANYSYYVSGRILKYIDQTAPQSTLRMKSRIWGALFQEEGLIGRELGRRLGLAHSDFRGLIRLWRHTSLSKARKLEVFNAVINTKLLYSLASAWLNTSER